VRPWRQSVTAALQELNDRIRATNEDFAQRFAGIGYKEINPARLERFFRFWSGEYLLPKTPYKQRVATSLHRWNRAPFPRSFRACRLASFA